jgi:hypothetical protein
MKDVGLNTKKFGTGQDQFTYLTLIFKFKNKVTSCLCAALRQALIHMHTKYAWRGPQDKKFLDKIKFIYFTLTLKVKVIVTSVLYATLCNVCNNRIGHKLFQLVLSSLFTCTTHIIYNNSKTYTT